MKLWFRLTIVCGALLGLLLGLTPPADWNYQSHVVRSGPCFDQGKETASDSSTASLVASMECDPARAASLESLVLDRALTVSNTGPPGQETHGPAELMVALGELPLKPATQTNAIQQPSPQIYWLSTAELKIGVPQQALARNFIDGGAGIAPALPPALKRGAPSFRVLCEVGQFSRKTTRR